MKYIQVILLFFLINAALATFNTTDFWRKSLNSTDPLLFQSFAGTLASTKDIRRSIGIGPGAPAACTISYSEPWGTI